MSLRLALWRLLWPSRSARAKTLAPGDRFPDFTLSDVDGRPFTLSVNPDGKATVLWLTNLCEDCRARVPLLAELAREAPGRFRVAGVSLLGEERELPRRVAEEGGFPVLLDPQDIVARDFGMPHPSGACPLHNLYVLDEKQRVVFRHHLSALAPEAFRALWRSLI